MDNYIPRVIYIFFGINTSLQASVYTKKIQVSCGIFRSIPLESDRQCSTCRNSRITEDARKSTIFLEVAECHRRCCVCQIGRISEDGLLSAVNRFSELVGFPKIFCTYFDRLRLAEIVDFRRCSTLFVLFAELVESPKIVFFGSNRFFRITRIFAEVTEDVFFVALVGFPKIAFFYNVRYSIYVVFPKIFCACFDSARFVEIVEFPKMFNSVRFSQRLSKITEDDSLYAELGGFPKMSEVFRRSQKIERVNNE